MQAYKYDIYRMYNVCTHISIITQLNLLVISTHYTSSHRAAITAT